MTHPVSSSLRLKKTVRGLLIMASVELLLMGSNFVSSVLSHAEELLSVMRLMA